MPSGAASTSTPPSPLPPPSGSAAKWVLSGGAPPNFRRRLAAEQPPPGFGPRCPHRLEAPGGRRSTPCRAARLAAPDLRPRGSLAERRGAVAFDGQCCARLCTPGVCHATAGARASFGAGWREPLPAAEAAASDDTTRLMPSLSPSAAVGVR
jgi:hypothetical protein